MNDDRPDLEVFQQCRDLVFGDWTSAAIFVPLRVWIGEKLLHHLLRCYLRAVLGKHRPQCREQLNSDAWLIWSAREVNRRPTCLLGPTTTSMLRNLQQQFPISTQPIVKAWRLRWLHFLMIRTLSEAHRASLRRIVENSGSPAYAKSSVFSSGFLGHILRIILRLAIVRGNLVLPRMPRIFGQNGSYQRPCRGISCHDSNRHLRSLDQSAYLGGHHQGTMDLRASPSAAERGTWPRSLRRAILARSPSPCAHDNARLRLPATPPPQNSEAGKKN